MTKRDGPVSLVVAMTSAVLILALVVVLKHAAALAISIDDYTECFDKNLHSASYMAGIFYAAAVVAYSATVYWNVSQYRKFRVSGSINPELPWAIQLIIPGLGIVAILMTVWIFANRAALTPLLKSEEFKMDFGQVVVLATSIFWVLWCTAHLLKAQGDWQS